MDIAYMLFWMTTPQGCLSMSTWISYLHPKSQSMYVMRVGEGFPLESNDSFKMFPNVQWHFQMGLTGCQLLPLVNEDHW